MTIDAWEVIHQIHQFILQADSIESIRAGFGRLLDRVHLLIPFATADLLCYDLDGRIATLVVSYPGARDDIQRGLSWSIPNPEVYRGLDLDSVPVIPAGDGWLPFSYVQSLQLAGTRVAACAPLVSGGTVIGSLVLAHDRGLLLTREQEALIQCLAEGLTIVLRKAAPCFRSLQRANELETIVTISTVLRKARSRSEMYPIFTHAVTTALHADVGVLLMLEDSGLTVKASQGAEELIGQHYELGLGAFWQVLQEPAPVYLSLDPDEVDENAGSPWIDLTCHARSIALIPLTATDQAIGILFLGRFHEQPFTVLEEHELGAVAEMGGNAFRRATIMETLEQRVEDRTRAIGALYDIASSANTSLSLQEMLEHALEKTVQTYQCSYGMIHLLDREKGELHLAVQRGWREKDLAQVTDWFKQNPFWRWIDHRHEPVWILSMENDPRFNQDNLLRPARAYLGVPIQSRGQKIGVLSLMGKNVVNFTQDDFSLATMISDQIGILLESFRSRKLAEAKAVIEERQRLARDLHDSVTQSLYSLVFLSESWRRAIHNDSLAQAQLWPDELEKIAQQALKEMRLLLYELRPVNLDEFSLAEALRQRLMSVEERANIHAEMNVSGEDHLPQNLIVDVYQIANEALNNILKHAACTRVRVNLAYFENSVRLEICDNGRGFDLSSPPGGTQGGLGLRGMRERIKKIGGRLDIHSKPGCGAKITVQVGW